MSQYLSATEAHHKQAFSVSNKSNNGLYSNVRTSFSNITNQNPARGAPKPTFLKELRRYTLANNPSVDDLQLKELQKLTEQQEHPPSPTVSPQQRKLPKALSPSPTLSNKEKSPETGSSKTDKRSRTFSDVLFDECEICCVGCSIRRRRWLKSPMPRMKPGKWKKVRLVLKSDSTLMICKEPKRAKKPPSCEVEVALRDVGEFIAYGAFTQGVPGRPPGLKSDDLILMIPEEPRTNGRIHWLRLRDHDSLHKWLLAICSVLKLPAPPPPRPLPCSSREATATITGFHMSGTPYLSSYASTSMASSLNDLCDSCADMSLTIQVDTGLELLARYQRDHRPPPRGAPQCDSRPPPRGAPQCDLRPPPRGPHTPNTPRKK